MTTTTNDATTILDLLCALEEEMTERLKAEEERRIQDKLPEEPPTGSSGRGKSERSGMRL